MSHPSLSRRILFGLLAAPALLPGRGSAETLPEVTSIPDSLKGSGEIRVATFGGTMQEVQKRAYFEPFEKLSGIRVRDFAGSDITKIKAMVETGNVEWDLAQVSRGSVMNLQKRGDYFEKIDYDIIDAGVPAAFRFEYGLEMLVWAQVLAYRTDAFRGAVPKGWADFWDTKKFPGDRALLGAGSGNQPELEFALMAAGVPPEQVYPMDLDKAFASYTKIKRDVVKWWETGAVPVQLLTDREVVMTSVWNGRMAALQQAGVPAAVSWSQGLLKRDCWAIPKGSRNRAQAMKFIAYSTMAIPQARLSMLIPYGSVNDGANEYLSPARQEVLPSAPAIRSQLLTYNYDWWVENRDAVTARFNRWLLT
ncbi:ABC transporter substrate-binding protein [Belnapia rosea]|uniref:Putative spermidine/putrescine transport system substrate-binding protein n=1 Tax=Belnapia rosea TaxID=938405 RepID=A0A1G6TCC4_9PROT|nr:ABC transporter substrate-binding protein [Belnapia rosea]SDB67821.1 putative spermidine/putrescine transport system substrate-binding protein [Belnapia rosea]SDD25955.1 putative spermidine/putrescine transport system substrate-binding protein [Belnapia rosea]